MDEETWVGRSEQYRQYRREQLSKELQKEVEWSSEDEHELELGLTFTSSIYSISFGSSFLYLDFVHPVHVIQKIRHSAKARSSSQRTIVVTYWKPVRELR